MQKAKENILWGVAVMLTVLYGWYLINNLTGVDRLVNVQQNYHYIDTITALVSWE